MNEEKDVQEMLALYAGIALPGVIGRAGMFYDPAEVAKDCFDVAEAMIVELAKRTQNECASSTDA
jgi:hypothetical protein